MNPVLDYDFGPNFNYNDGSGIIDQRAAAGEAGDPDARAQGRCGRQRDRRHQVAADAAAARDLYRVESDRERSPQGPRGVAGRPAMFRSRRRRPIALRAATRACRSRSGTRACGRTTQAAFVKAENIVRRRFLLPEDALRLMKQLLSDLKTQQSFHQVATHAVIRAAHARPRRHAQQDVGRSSALGGLGYSSLGDRAAIN